MVDLKRIAVVGAGFSGAVIAHLLAEAGLEIDVFETRDHVAGNCFTRRDPETNILVHVYGPHIFHTDKPHIWDFVNRFDTMELFVNRVKAITGGHVYSLPINLMTINQFFGKTLNPAEASEFIRNLGASEIKEPVSFEEQALKFIGRDLYGAFFRDYTIKQWGVEPSHLPASILKRLPVRFNYDDNYYTSKFQGIPRNGYTHIVEKLLDHGNIKVHLSSAFERASARDYDRVFYSGPLDQWFGHSEGRLGYRTLDFVEERYDGDFQGNPVVNYCDMTVPWTRISEHKHFSPHESHTKTIIFKEYSRACSEADMPYYPIRLLDDKTLLSRYTQLAEKETNTTFVGRLGTYRYLDMDVAIDEAMIAAQRLLDCRRTGNVMPSFVINVA